MSSSASTQSQQKWYPYGAYEVSVDLSSYNVQEGESPITQAGVLSRHTTADRLGDKKSKRLEKSIQEVDFRSFTFGVHLISAVEPSIFHTMSRFKTVSSVDYVKTAKYKEPPSEFPDSLNKVLKTIFGGSVPLLQMRERQPHDYTQPSHSEQTIPDHTSSNDDEIDPERCLDAWSAEAKRAVNEVSYDVRRCGMYDLSQRHEGEDWSQRWRRYCVFCVLANLRGQSHTSYRPPHPECIDTVQWRAPFSRMLTAVFRGESPSK